MEVTTPELADPAVAGGEAMEDTAAGVAAAVAVPGPMEVVNVDDWPTSAPGVANGTATLEMPEPISTPPHELPALKVTFYELLVRQLQDDGFLAEAQSLAQQLHVEPNPRVDKDALLEAYGKSLKWAFDDEPRGNWTPVNCTPVPPLGPREKVLDFGTSTLGAAGPGGDSSPGAPRPPVQPLAGLTDPALLAARRAPEVRLLYTSAHKQACRAVVFSTDGRYCATGCADGSIRILDSARMRMCAASSEGPLGRVRVTEEELMKPVVRTLQDHVLGITCLAFHPMNPTLFAGSVDKAVKIFDLTRPPGHKKAFSVLQDVHPVRSIAIHPCGDFLLVATSHQAIRLYDLQTLNCFTTFHQDHHHTGAINDVRCTSDGRVFASASADGSIQLWDAVTHRVMNSLPKSHSGAAVTSLRWSRTMRYLLSSGSDGRCRLWDVRQGRDVFVMGFGPRSCEFSNAVFAASERYVVSSNSNIQTSDVSVYDAQTGSPVFMKLGLHQSPVHALDASPTDKTLMTGCDDEKARYFSIDDRGG